MKDIRGLDIEIGQQVACLYASTGKIHQQNGIVVKITDHKVHVEYLGNKWNFKTQQMEYNVTVRINRIPNHIVIL